jgi:hypothetical protein
MPDATPNLLPCPFCGSSVKLECITGAYDREAPKVQIECKKCKRLGGPFDFKFMGRVAFSHDTEDWAPGKGHFSIRTQAIDTVVARWNQRPIIPSSPTTPNPHA